MLRASTSFLLMLLLAACASSPRATLDEIITVEGRASVRGNAPFTALVLETDARNLYVLETTDATARLRDAVPGRFRVTGTLYRDDWNGRPYAHLRVSHWERTD